jgi:hypothetical protein
MQPLPELRFLVALILALQNCSLPNTLNIVGISGFCRKSAAVAIGTPSRMPLSGQAGYPDTMD